MRLEKLLARDDIPEDAKVLIRTEIEEQEKYRNNRKKSSESIELREEQFRLIFEKAPLGIELYNAEGQLIDANQLFLDIFGVKSIQSIRGFNLFMDPNIPPYEKIAMKQGTAVHFEEQFNFELVKQKNLYQTSKSGIIYLEVYIQPIKSDNQTIPIGYLVFVQDITKRKQVELALKDSEEQFRLLFEEAPIPILDYDLSEVIKYMAQLEIQNTLELDKYLERDPEGISKIAKKLQLIGANEAAFKFFQIENTAEWSLNTVGDPKSGHPFFRQILNTILLGRTSLEDEFTAQTVKEKKRIRALCKASFFSDTQKRKDRAIASLIDITDLKIAEEALREERDLAQRYLDVTGVMMVALDADQRVTLVNKKGCEVLGFPEEEIIGKNWFNTFLPERVRSSVKEIFNTLLMGNVEPVEYSEGLILTKDNEERTIAWHNTVLRDEDGNITGTLSSGEDITERKITEQVRLELEQRRDNFVWMTSHELRTPLTVIFGYIDFLQKNVSNIVQDQQNKILETIRSNLHRLERLTDQVSLLAQFKYGTFNIKESAFDFCAFFNETLEPYKNMLGEQIKFDECVMDSPLIIEGDKDRLIQVFDNILNNAVKHTHSDHRSIKVTLEIIPTILRIKIKDNGAGIASENLERIFEQFVSIGTVYSATGTGIGLYLSQKIMKAHGGIIIARSEGLGSGSTFIIELPRKQ
ncbi:MAG: PAS domain S-box protein [Candidatus Hodarchaeota archaeon]